MKKLMTIFGAILFASVVMISCGDDNSSGKDKNTALEKDAKAMADGICGVEKLVEDAATDPEKQKELEETGHALKEKMEKLMKEMQEKYKDEKSKSGYTKDFEKAVEKALEDCK